MQIRLLAIWASLIGRWKRVKIRLYGKRLGKNLAAQWGSGEDPPSSVLVAAARL